MDFHGEDAPLNTNSTELERAENRRVHFEIKYHLVDKLSANDLMEEYKSLLDSIYGKGTVVGPPKTTEVLEENEEILITNDSIPAIQNDTLMIIEEVPAREGSENDNE